MLAKASPRSCRELRDARIASKLAPTEVCSPPRPCRSRACSRWHHRVLAESSATSGSRASSLLQEFEHRPAPVGAELARDGITAFLQRDSRRLDREQARSYRGLSIALPCRSRACSRWHHRVFAESSATPGSRASSLLQRFEHHPAPVEAELARDGITAFLQGVARRLDREQARPLQSGGLFENRYRHADFQQAVAVVHQVLAEHCPFCLLAIGHQGRQRFTLFVAYTGLRIDGGQDAT